MDIVYPNNPDEYDDVALEALVLLAPVIGTLGGLDRSAIYQVVQEGLARCFGEPADMAKVDRAVRSSMKDLVI